jgi:threonine/homoserine efflux transporter RhtA
VIELVFSQLSDVFRIGLIMALVVTMLRTSSVTGRVLPLIAGVVFVAVIVPSTLSGNSETLSQEIAAGLISNLIILLPVLVLAKLISRLRR